MRIIGLVERSGLAVCPRTPDADTDPSRPLLPVPLPTTHHIRRIARIAIRAARLVVLLSVTVFDRFGITVGKSSIDASLITLYLFVAVCFTFDCLELSMTRLLIYFATVASAVGSYWINTFVGEAESLPSLGLLIVLYAPFVVSLRPGVDERSDGSAAAAQFLTIAFLCAIAGILQFYLQFLIHPAWLFDYTPLIPPLFRCTPGNNTVFSIGPFVKSNGFFFREPSGFSFVMGLAIIMEWSHGRRPLRLACFIMGLLLAYSGTGILTLVVALLVPFNAKVLLRLLAAACAAGVLFFLLGDALNLSFIARRVHEFGSERSSGYIRYIAPARLVYDTFNDALWTPFFGHGPGTISRATINFQSHDPTWAKAIFEYGLLGFTLVSGLYAAILRESPAPLRWRVVLFATWLVTGGLLLSAPANALRLCLVGFLPRALAPLVRGRQGEESHLAGARGA